MFHCLSKYKKNKGGIILFLLICLLDFTNVFAEPGRGLLGPYRELDIVLEDNQYALVPYNFGYAILTKEGYYNAEGLFIPYTSAFPSELEDIELRTLSSTKLLGKTYLLYPGGGMLYTFDKGALKRIDASFAHRNYHDAHFFSHNNNLYLLGGYGLWTTKKDLLTYDFSSNQWEKVTTSGEVPSNGVWNISAVQTNAALYIVNSSYVATNNQKNRVNPKVYRLDLTTMEWSQTYNLDENTAAYLAQRRHYGLQIGEEWVVFPTDARQEYLAIDPEKGEIKTRSSQDFFASTRKPLFLDGQFVSLRRQALSSPRSELLIQYYNDTPYENLTPLGKNTDPAKNALLWAAGVFSFFILLWRLLYGTKTFVLEQSSIGRRRNKIALTDGEVFFLAQLAKYGHAKNNNLVHFFSEEGKTQDLFVKRKNAMIKALDTKLRARFKHSFFIKTTDPSDQRHSIYTIAPRVIIHHTT